MVSKELLSEVLGRECTSFVIRSNIITYNCKVFGLQGYKFSKVVENINIHELAHKCKEWAYIKGYSIITMSDFDLRHDNATNYHEYYFTAYVNMNLFPELNKKEYTHLYDVSAETEPEAIFKACQWIFDNKDTK